MDQLTKDIQEVFGTQPNYAMFTDIGNDAVDAIVRNAKAHNLSWPQVFQKLRDLARSDRAKYGEALDTAVREMVYDAIGAGQRGEDFYV